MAVENNITTSLLAMEHPLLKVPYEGLCRTFRNSQRIIEKEIVLSLSSIAEFSAHSNSVSEFKSVALNALCKLKTLKRKLAESLEEEEKTIDNFRIRLRRLQESQSKEFNSLNAESEFWKKERLDRILVDYMLREGFYTTSHSLAADSKILDYVNEDLFLASYNIEKSLQDHICTPALLWCSENKIKLRKMKSSLEFNLRVQEFIELARKNQRMEAIFYARKHFSNCIDGNLREIQRAMGLLAFSSDTKCSQYSELYSQGRWRDLIRQFREENHQLHSLTSQSLLSITLQAGLSALKTRMCFQPENKTLNCPVCTPTMGQLAENLPFSHRIHSCLVCRISNRIMNEDNPPMVLPNGYVYSLSALTEMSKTHDGYVCCPRTKETYLFSELKKVFVV
eukprot:Sdes_comp15423_c0_seq1m4316